MLLMMNYGQVGEAFVCSAHLKADRIPDSMIPRFQLIVPLRKSVQSVMIAHPANGKMFGIIFSMSTQIVPEKYKNAYTQIEAPQTIQLTGKSSVRQLMIGSNNSLHQKAAGVTTQQVAIAYALTSTEALWYLALDNVTTKSGYGASVADPADAIHNTELDSYQPFSLAMCLPDVIRGAADSRPVAFSYLVYANQPTLVNTNMKYRGFPYDAILYPGLNRPQVLDAPGSVLDSRLKWIELPKIVFNGSTIGVVVLLPRSESDES